MKTALVLGAGGFIGSHLVKRLKKEGYWVRGVDLKYPEFSETEADSFLIKDLTYQSALDQILTSPVDEVYQLAADMGGAGYIFTGTHDADIMTNSALINLNVLRRVVKVGVGKLFFSSSACIYPQENQTNPNDPNCEEKSAFPANPDSEYGWEKIFSERLYQAYYRNYDLDVRIARFHNIFGPEGAWNNGREKAPAAICRKIAMAKDGDKIDIWGDGKQTRTFLYIEECLEGVRRLMDNTIPIPPVNIGADHKEMISINQLVEIIAKIAGKTIYINHINGPVGVQGRCSDNTLIQDYLNWVPTPFLVQGLMKTYHWINKQVRHAR